MNKLSLKSPSLIIGFLRIIFIVFGCIAFLALGSCKKDAPKPVIETIDTTGIILSSGDLVSDEHPTSGKVKLYIKDNKKTLAFENIKSEGPALYVYLSVNTTITDYKDLGKLKALEGTFSYSVPDGVDTDKYNHVLIWCKDFTVLIGHTILKK